MNRCNYCHPDDMLRHLTECPGCKRKGEKTMTLKQRVLEAAKGKLPKDVNLYGGPTVSVLASTGGTEFAVWQIWLNNALPDDHVVWRMAALVLGIDWEREREIMRYQIEEFIHSEYVRIGGRFRGASVKWAVDLYRIHTKKEPYEAIHADKTAFTKWLEQQE